MLLSLYFQGKVIHLLPLVTFYINFGLILVIFIISIFADLDAARIIPRGQHQQGEEQENAPLLENTSEAQNTLLGLGQNPCPELSASFLSKCFYGWFFP
jgi:hypothetical protein